MSQFHKIRMPFRRHLRFFGQRQVPVLVWLAAAVLVVILARRQAVRVDAIGIARVQRVEVSAPAAGGRVKSLLCELFQPVQAGDIVAVLDDASIQAELKIVDTEIARLRTVITAEKARLEADARTRENSLQSDVRLFSWNVESAALDLLDRQVVQEVDKIEYQRLTVTYERLARLVAANVGSRVDLEEARLAREAVATRIAQNARAIEEARRRKDVAERRLRAMPTRAVVADLQSLLKPLQGAVQVQQARLEELVLRRECLVLRAPIQGVISRIAVQTGEAVAAGVPVLVIEDPRSTCVVAHVIESSRRIDIRPGDTVELLRRTSPVQVMAARVIRVGPSVEEVPTQIRRKSDILEWGRPILIAAAGLNLIPGETIDVRIPVPVRPPAVSHGPLDRPRDPVSR